MRLYGILRDDVLMAVSGPVWTGKEGCGNRRLMGIDRNGRAIIVVIAGDDPEFVITTFPDD